MWRQTFRAGPRPRSGSARRPQHWRNPNGTEGAFVLLRVQWYRHRMIDRRGFQSVGNEASWLLRRYYLLKARTCRQAPKGDPHHEGAAPLLYPGEGGQTQWYRARDRCIRDRDREKSGSLYSTIGSGTAAQATTQGRRQYNGIATRSLGSTGVAGTVSESPPHRRIELQSVRAVAIAAPC